MVETIFFELAELLFMSEEESLDILGAKEARTGENGALWAMTDVWFFLKLVFSKKGTRF